MHNETEMVVFIWQPYPPVEAKITEYHHYVTKIKLIYSLIVPRLSRLSQCVILHSLFRNLRKGE